MDGSACRAGVWAVTPDEPRRLVLLALRQLQARLLELIQQRRQLRRSALQWRRCGGPLRRVFSFIYTTGQREMDEKGLPDSSAWAAKYSCGQRSKPTEIADTKAGYVFDGTRQNPPNPAWGLLPGPGKAQQYVYPDCKDGRVVADVVRIDKGHTEGLEPNVTEQLIKLMLSAKGGKLQQVH